MTPDVSITSKVTADIAWARHHLFLLLAVVVLVFAGVFGVESLVAKHDDSKWEQTKQLLAAQQAQTKQLSDQYAADKKQRDAENAAKDAEILQLVQTIQKRDAATQKQVQIDSSLSAQEAAQRLSQQTKASPGEITAQGNNLLVDLPISRGIVTSLDRYFAAQVDLLDTQKQLADETVKFNNAQSDVKEQKGIVGALQTTLGTQQQACQQHIDQINSDARKSKTKIAGIFTVVGIIAAKFLGI